jgi:hypothetical protein
VKPREWKIWCTDIREQRIAGVDTGPDGAHVIEYSAYEAAIRERDELELNESKMDGALSAKQEQLTTAIRERDEARATIDDNFKGTEHLREQIITERARSAKLVEALETIRATDWLEQRYSRRESK